MSALQSVLSAGISEKAIEYGLVGLALIVMTWAYAHRVLGFRLLKVFKKKPVESNIGETAESAEIPAVTYDSAEHELEVLKLAVEIARLRTELKEKAYSESHNDNKQEEKVPLAV
jgi:hypothetical protein